MTDAPDAVRDNDHQGDTWAYIVGSSKIIELRIAPVGDTGGTTLVSAASITGMTATDVHTTALSATGGADGDGMYADGFQQAASNYDGIPGTAFCAGIDCSVDADGDLDGSWYFTPTMPMEWYVRASADVDYAPESLYVKFGHWLTPSDDDTVVNRYASNNAGASERDFSLAVDATTLTDTSAEYSGRAVGMSLHKEVNSDGAAVDGTLQSGAFTALVNLNATFGGSPTLGGTITGFDSENSGAFDSDWNVELQVTGLEPDGTLDGEGRTIATGADGVWSAQAYGTDAAARPAGIFGGFNAHFSDGHAAGAYATRKD